MRHVYLLVLAALTAGAVLVVQVGAASAGSAQVTNANDAGPGSFRAAVVLANADASVGHIVFVGNLDSIELQSTVVYTGQMQYNDGINFREDAPGNLAASVRHSAADDNSEDGIHFDENAVGNLTSTAGHGSASGNAEVGVLGDQAGAADVGTLDVLFMPLVGNGVDDVAVVGNVTLTQTP